MSTRGTRFLQHLNDIAAQGTDEPFHPDNNHPAVIFAKMRTNSNPANFKPGRIDIKKLAEHQYKHSR